MPAINAISADKLARLIGTLRLPGSSTSERRRRPDPRRPSAAGRKVAPGRPPARRERPSSSAITARSERGRRRLAAHAGVPPRLAGRRRAAGPRPACRWCRSQAAAARPKGRTVWVTRRGPKVDRIACPWLIRRFVDPNAVFLFVAPAEVAGVAERFGRDALRRRGRVLEPSRRALHLRRHGRGVRPGASGLCRGSLRSCAAPTRRGWTSRPRPPGCLPRRSACRACMPTISSSSRPA
jgi:hypothetical protein